MDMVRETDRDELAAFDRPDIDAPPEPRAKSRARKGRGAATNPAVRFDTVSTEPVDDEWPSSLEALGELPPLPTTLIRDASRSVISWNTSPDIGFDRAVNPYRGCEHGCVYCYARPTHAYLGYSPGLDFETKLLFKPDVAALLERELRKPGYVARPLALGSNTDPYQPIERTLKLTRAVLDVLERCGHPLSIVTKSATVVRDVDILSPAGEAQSGAGLAVGHHTRPEARPHHGAARLLARDAAAGGGDPLGRWGADRRFGGTDDPGRERRRAGGDHRGGGEGRGGDGGLRAAAPAARAARHFHRLARGAHAGPGEEGAGAGPRRPAPAT